MPKPYVTIQGGSKLSSFITPMMATLSGDPAFNDPNWIFEIKWDGYRAIAEVRGNATRLYSRNGLTYDKAYPKIFNALKALDINAVLDGEVVVYDYQGKPSFHALQNYNSRQNLAIQFQVFDLLEVDGKDVTKKPLLERKKILQELLPGSDVIKYCDHIHAEGKTLYEHASKIGLEGIIAKRADSKYYTGKRSKEWLKVKNILTDDFVIIGWTAPQNSRQHFGSLMLAERTTGGKLVYVGDVGTGFNDRSLREVFEKLEPIERKSPPMRIEFKVTQNMHFVEPHYVCQVEYTERTADGHVRHPSFQGLRTDK